MKKVGGGEGTLLLSRLGDEESTMWHCWGKGFPGRGDSWCKGPEAATNWAYSKNAEYGQCGWNGGKGLEKPPREDRGSSSSSGLIPNGGEATREFKQGVAGPDL